MYGLSALTDVAVGRRWTAVVVDVFVLMILLVDVKGCGRGGGGSIYR